MSGFFQDFIDRMDKAFEEQAAKRMVQIGQARQEWVGRRVYADGITYQGYARIESIGDDGFVVVDYEQVPCEWPSRIRMKFEALGTIIRHVGDMASCYGGGDAQNV